MNDSKRGNEWGPAVSDTEAADLTCCGQTVDVDGFCQYRPGHPRRITPELVDRAVSAAAPHADLTSQVRAVLAVAFRERS